MGRSQRSALPVACPNAAHTYRREATLACADPALMCRAQPEQSLPCGVE